MKTRKIKKARGGARAPPRAPPRPAALPRAPPRPAAATSIATRTPTSIATRTPTSTSTATRTPTSTSTATATGTQYSLERLPPPAVITKRDMQPILDAVNTWMTQRPADDVLFASVQRIMAQFQAQSTVGPSGTILQEDFGLTQEDIDPLVNLYNSFTPDIKALVPKIVPPLLVPVFKTILPTVTFP